MVMSAAGVDMSLPRHTAGEDRDQQDGKGSDVYDNHPALVAAGVLCFSSASSSNFELNRNEWTPVGIDFLQHYLRAAGDVQLRDDDTDQAQTLVLTLCLLLKADFCRVSALSSSGVLLLLRVYLVLCDPGVGPPPKLPGGSSQVTIDAELPKRTKTREVLRSVLELLRTDALTWNGVGKSDGDESAHRVCAFSNKLGALPSLGDIYHDLPSPHPDESLTANAPPDTRHLLSQALDAEGPPGLTSSLHPYQKRSLWAMLQRELLPTLVPDPWPLRIDPPSGGRHYYIDPKTFSVMMHVPSHFEDVRGGVLCEEMGVGKTIECLALILATKAQLPRPDIEPLASQVTSDLALRAFPQQEYQGNDPGRALMPDRTMHELPYYPQLKDVSTRRTRHQTGHETDSTDEVASWRSMPRLVDLCAHRVRTCGLAYSNEQLSELPPPVSSLLREASPFMLLWPPVPVRIARVPQARTPLKIFLSSATLVCVPATLVVQWQAEIAKHTAPGALRVLVLATNSACIPEARILAEEYDIVLLSHARFGREHDDGLLETRWPGVPRACRCPYIGSSRIVDCRCPRPPDARTATSPLAQVVFKRLLIDEGNVMSGDSGLVRLATRLRVERKWIVSGTPTPALIGSAFAQTALEAPSEDASAGSADSSGSLHQWISRDRKDLERLRGLLVHFLQLPPFHAVSLAAPSAGVRDWNAHVILPLLSSERPELGAIDRLEKIMKRIMIRNSASDVEKDCPLPPLRTEVARLEFSGEERATHNILQALITLNAVFTQRTDEDYFFHASSRKSLASIIENLSLSCFFFAGESLVEQATEALAHARKRLLKKGHSMSAADRNLTCIAIGHLHEALSDERWCTAIGAGDVLFGLENLSPDIWDAWSRGPRGPSTSNQLVADEIVKMRRALAKTLKAAKAEMDDDDLIEELITAGQKDVRAWVASQQRAVQRKSAVRDAAPPSSPTKKTKNRANNAQVQRTESIDSQRAPAGTHARLSAMSADVQRAEAARERHAELVLDVEAPKAEVQARSGALDSPWQPLHGEEMKLRSNSALACAKVNRVSSTKLRWILNYVLQYAGDEKILIFSALDNVLFEIAAALDVARVEYLCYVTGLSQAKRNAYASEFSQGSRFRILIMSTNIGGRGLDLHCASRVVFAEPVWQRDLELQALKRAYRIGQTRPVHVTTLVIKDTFEERILDRRRELARGQEDKSVTKTMEDDGTMRDFIANPRFIPPAAQDRDSTRELRQAIEVFPSAMGHQEGVITVIPIPAPPTATGGQHLGPNAERRQPQVKAEPSEQQEVPVSFTTPSTYNDSKRSERSVSVETPPLTPAMRANNGLATPPFSPNLSLSGSYFNRPPNHKTSSSPSSSPLAGKRKLAAFGGNEPRVKVELEEVDGSVPPTPPKDPTLPLGRPKKQPRTVTFAT